MSVDDWNTFVKIAVRREVFLRLQVELSSNKKSDRIVHHLFKTSNHLFQLLSVIPTSQDLFSK